MKKILKGVRYFLAFVTITVLSHWLLINLYVKMCAPLTLFGAIQTFISMGSPLCHFINFAQHELSKHYITLWSGAAVAFTSWLTFTENSKK